MINRNYKKLPVKKCYIMLVKLQNKEITQNKLRNFINDLLITFYIFINFYHILFIIIIIK